MVLIIPTSGCIKFDLKNISRQMINIEQNTYIFKHLHMSSQCNCIYTNAHPDSIEEQELYTDFTQYSSEKYNIYKIPNPIYPEYPIIIEPFSMIGNIVIYINNSELSQYLEYQVARVLSNNCNNIMMNIYGDEYKKNGLNFINTSNNRNVYLSSKYTLYYENIDFNLKRNINYCSPFKNRKTLSDDNFIWNVYIINTPTFSLIDYFNYPTLKYFNPKSRNASIKSAICERVNTYTIKKLKYIENEFLNLKTQKLYKNNSSMMYSPNTIFLDGANLLINKQITKQLEFPKFSQFNLPNYIDLTINVYSNNEIQLSFDYLLTNSWQIDNGIISKLYSTTNLSLNNLSILFSNITWIHDSIEFYYLKYYNSDILLDLSENLNNIKQNIKNTSSGHCYITGIPLWNNYFEIQFICNITKSKKIIVCMEISKLGLHLLYNAPSLYSSQIKDKYFKSNNFLDYLKYILNIKNKYKAEYFNIIIKESKLSIEDVINTLSNNNQKKLLLSIEKYGSVYYNSNLFIANPETNDVFIGIFENDLNDILLLHMKYGSNAYVFPITI
jgi:hypothetical protein